MSSTSDKINRIISEIENNETSSHKSVEEVMGILLGNDTGYNNGNGGCDTNTENTGFSFDLAEFGIWREKNNHLYNIEYYRPLVTHRRGLRKIVLLCKRVIRKLIKFLMIPILRAQNEFNASITASINAIYNNDIVTQSFMGAVLTELAHTMDIITNLNSSQSTLSNTIHDIQTTELRIIKGRQSEIERRLNDLSESNSSNENSIGKIERLLDDLSESNRSNENSFGEIEKHFDNLNEQFNNSRKFFDESITSIKMAVNNMYSYLDRSELQVLRAIKEIQNNKNEIEKDLDTKIRSASSHTGLFEKQDDVYTVIDYFDFENHFRGSRKSIKEAQEKYIPYYQNKQYVVDLGCGRGEFLELLHQNSINGIGIDIYEEFVDYCRLKGLEAVHADAISYLSALEDESIDGLFASQIAEHLETTQLVELCRRAYQKLRHEGCFILETPNPTSLSTYINNFYMDPSHVKPVHPQTLEYLLKQAGFKSVKILYTENSTTGYRLPLLNGEQIHNLIQFNDGLNLLSDILFGSMDYAIIAEK